MERSRAWLSAIRTSAASSLIALLLFAAGCGPSDTTLCNELTSNPCPPGKATLVDDQTTCINDLHGNICSSEYKTLVECQIAHPSCNTKNPDGSLTLDGPVECADELDKFLGCGRAHGV
jgi:hypothetical protein